MFEAVAPDWMGCGDLDSLAACSETLLLEDCGKGAFEGFVVFVCEGEWEVMVGMEGRVAGGAEVEVRGVKDVLRWGAVKLGLACG